MPGELANVLAGRVANLFDLRGPELHHRCGVRLRAGRHVSGRARPGRPATSTPRSPAASTATWASTAFVKFCKIGALSATGTRPFDAGADGFVMGEGAALFVLKRLADAERDGDRMYAVLLGLGGSSDGKGKGITAPNPVGQRLAVERAWRAPGSKPATASCGRGARHLDPGRRRDRAREPRRGLRHARARRRVDRPGLGQVQHRPPQGRGRGRRPVQDGACSSARAGAGAEPALPRAQPQRRLGRTSRSRSTPSCATGRRPASGVRRGGRQRLRVRRHQLPRGRSRSTCPAGTATPGRAHGRFASARRCPALQVSTTAAWHGAGRGGRRRCAAPSVVGGADDADAGGAARAGWRRSGRRRRPPPRGARSAPWPRRVRVAIDYADAADLAAKAGKAVQALRGGNPGAVEDAARPGRLRRPRRPAPKVAFLYTGQGSQYVNMLRDAARARADRRRRHSPRPTGS